MNYFKAQYKTVKENLKRLKKLLTNPDQTWLEISQEQITVQNMLKYQLLIFALIPVICAFISDAVIGVEMFNKVHRKPVFSSLVNSFLYYLSIIAFVFLLSFGLKVITIFFELKVGFINTFKIIHYSVFPVLFFSLFNLIPGASFLVYLIGVYSVYIFYKGLPILIKNQHDKSIILTTLLIVLLFIVISMLVVLVDFFGNSILQN
jgi:hypothetical protein